MSSFVARLSKLKGIHKGRSGIQDEEHTLPVRWSIHGGQNVFYGWCCFCVMDPDLNLAACKKEDVP